MPNDSEQMLLEGIENAERPTSTALEWIARSYESLEQWKRTGKELFFSLNGQSDVTRNRLASIIRRYFVNTALAAEDIRRWKPNSNDQETVHVIPPKISESNSAYIDWIYLADYVLLACAAVTEELEQENQKRASEYRQALDSYNIRLTVFDAQTIIRENKNLSDSEVLVRIQKKHKGAAVAHVKEARKLDRQGARCTSPKPPSDSPAIHPYTPLYFDLS